MIPGGREPLARPPQDPFLAFLDRLAERHEERLLPGASQNAHRPLAKPGQLAPFSSTQPSATHGQRSDSERCRSRLPLDWPRGRRTVCSSRVLFPRLVGLECILDALLTSGAENKPQA